MSVVMVEFSLRGGNFEAKIKSGVRVVGLEPTNSGQGMAVLKTAVFTVSPHPHEDRPGPESNW